MPRSSQDSITDQPPLKKHKAHGNPTGSSQVSKEEQFQFSQSFKSTNSSISQKSIVIKKGDKIQKRVSQLLTTVLERDEPVFLMSSGESLQKMISILEIFKLKLKDNKDFKFEQFNKLDHFKTFIKKNEILSKEIKVPVLYTLIRKVKETSGADDDAVDFDAWNRQEI